MPSNRRSGANRQPSARRPKVAGLRKRPTSPASSSSQAEDEEVNGTAVTDQAQDARTDETASESTASEADGTVAAESGSAEVAGGSEKPGASESESAADESDEDSESSEEAESSEDARSSEDAGSSEDTGSSETSAAKSESSDGESQDSDTEEAAKSGKPWLLWAATALLLALAIFFGVATYTTYYTGPAANEALTSAGETSEVNGQVSDGVQKLFSYDFNDTAKTENAAKDLLVGSAVQKYNELFALVKQQAPQQQLIVTTTVKNSAVTRLEGDRAEVLVFVDQHAMRANTGESNIGPAQLSVSAEKQGDKWKITNLTLR
ncbi:hypothetical protein [Saccharopolyspora flava]|uniref:Mce-associated membrane protein n=1 Tax=Saccharopolyspora flava TaxID=95161 RepID=A0A1I6PWG9_9PSEU|nr:hypothetical protein [Saccharopolyspora flava]SFS44553.1 Mce-associated membrane protein [Saccharopolyspora flava]